MTTHVCYNKGASIYYGKLTWEKTSGRVCAYTGHGYSILSLVIPDSEIPLLLDMIRSLDDGATESISGPLTLRHGEFETLIRYGDHGILVDDHDMDDLKHWLGIIAEGIA